MDIKILASGSSGNCYLVSDGRTRVLLDAGIPAKEISRGLGYGLTSVDAVLVTHEHGDHCKAVNDLGNRYGVPIFLSQGTIDGSADKDWKVTTPLAEIVRDRVPFRVGTFTVLPFSVEHDAVEPLGFLLESEAGGKVLYFTDTAFLRWSFTGITHLLAECNYVREILEQNVAEGSVPRAQAVRTTKSHMSLETLLDFLRRMDRSRLQQIYLIHLSKRNGEERRMALAVKALTGVEVYTA